MGYPMEFLLASDIIQRQIGAKIAGTGGLQKTLGFKKIK